MSNSSSGAIRAGKAFVEIFANDSKFIKALERSKKALLAFSKKISIVGAAVSGFGGSVLGTLAKAADNFISRADAIAKMAERFGTSTEIVSELAYAFERVGLSTEDTADILKDMQKNIAAAASGNAELANKFAELGVNVQDIINLPIDQQLEAIADGLATIENPAKRNALAMQLLGEKGGKAAALLGKGSAAIREYRKEAKAIGASVSTEDAELATEAMDQLEKIISTLKYTFISLGQAILPSKETMREIGTVIFDVGKSVREFIQENRSLVQIVGIVAAAISAVGIALLGIGGAAAIASVAIGGLVTIATTIGAVFSAVFSVAALKIALVVAIVAGLAYALYSLLDLGEPIREMFASVKDFLGGVFAGIKDAILAGDIKLAFSILVQSLLVLWQDLVVKMQRIWNRFKGFFVDGWHKIGESITDVILDFYSFLFRKFSSVFEKIYSTLRKAAKSLGFDELAEKLAKAEELARNPARIRELQAEIQKEREQKRQERLNAREKALEDAREKLAEEQNKLDELIGEAAAKRALKEAMQNQEQKMTSSKKQLGPAILSASRGVFSASNYQQVFGGIGGITEIEKKQLDVQKNIEKGIEDMNDQIAQFINVFKFV
jgi:hypothetical protein